MSQIPAVPPMQWPFHHFFLFLGPFRSIIIIFYFQESILFSSIQLLCSLSLSHFLSLVFFAIPLMPVGTWYWCKEILIKSSFSLLILTTTGRHSVFHALVDCPGDFFLFRLFYDSRFKNDYSLYFSVITSTKILPYFFFFFFSFRIRVLWWRG